VLAVRFQLLVLSKKFYVIVATRIQTAGKRIQCTATNHKLGISRLPNSV